MNQRILGSKYAIHSIVGKGGMAIVYKGKNVETNEVVAIKMLKDEYLENTEFVTMFEKEAEIAKVVRHKNMVNTFDVGTDDGCPYLVMEYVQGRTLKEYISMKGIIPEAEAVDIAMQVCDAIKYAHDNKLVHRDIKSQNILINTDGVVKVGDFGIAKMTTSATMTTEGSNVLGSVHYMSPEQAMGNVVDHTTDIYSLGIVMYEMFTGTLPFKGETPVTIALKHVNDGLPSPMTKNHSLSYALDKIIMKASNKLRDLRYQSAQEVKDDLIKSKDDPSGDFIEEIKDDGETKILPKISKEMVEQASQNYGREALGEEAPESDDNLINGSGEAGITDIGLYESDTLRQTNQQRIHDSIAIRQIRKVVILVLLSIFAVVAVLFGILELTNETAEPEETTLRLEVPEVEGMLIDEAKRTVNVGGFDYIIEYINDDVYSEGIVMSQAPKGGQMINSNIYVTLRVSLGPELFAVPDVVNISFNEAIAVIKEMGFEVGDVSQEVSDLPSEYIVRQDPKAGAETPIGEKINIWIATEADTTIPVMPNVIGRTLEEAIYLLDSIDISLDRIEVVPIDSGYDKDIVIYHEPDFDKVINDEDSIVLYVSNGEEETHSIEKNILLSLTNDTTQVRIEYVDEGMKQVVYNKVLTKGDHEVTLTLYTNTPGVKDLIIYYDGQEVAQDRVEFEVSE